jgi:hypothetical protein
VRPAAIKLKAALTMCCTLCETTFQAAVRVSDVSAVLMAMGSVFWERGAYSALEHLFRQSAEFCSEHEAWKLNVAHTFFMQVCCEAPEEVVNNYAALWACRHSCRSSVWRHVAQHDSRR